MANTSFDSIYKRFMSKPTDYEWGDYSEDELKVELLDYILTAISKFKFCKQDLNNHGLAELFHTQTTIADAGVITLDYIPIDGVLNIDNSGTAIVVSGVTTRTVDLSGEGITDEQLTITYAAEMMAFGFELTNDEIEILTDYMIIRWHDTKFVNRQTLLKQNLPSKDFNNYSPANHLKSLLDLRVSSERNVERLRSIYTYDDLDIRRFLRH